MVSTRKPNLGTQAYEKLRRLLIHAQIPSGIKLIESEWAKRLGVHRIAVREAMVLLAHEGLLRPGPRGGFVTPILEQRDLDEVMEVRRVIEVGAIRLLSERGLDDAQVKQLESICDLMRANLDGGMELGFIEADRAFHRTLVEMSKNQRLVDLYNRAPLPLWPSKVTDPAQRHTNALRTIADHREICALLSSGRTGEVVELIDRHLHASRPTTLVTKK